MFPGEDLVYLGDTARVPYGTKSARAISQFASEGSLFLMREDVKLLVIACNTMSATCLTDLAKSLPVPVVGVIDPGVDGACEACRNGRVGVIGTNATIASQAYQRGIVQRQSTWHVFSQPCPLFVPLVEEGWEETEAALMIARQYLAPLVAQDIDTLVLGCTHYPLLIPTLQRIVGPGVQIVDSATQTSKAVRKLLDETGLRSARSEGALRVFLTDIPPSFIGMADRFLARPVTHVERVELPACES
jgi:glutamate racemase